MTANLLLAAPRPMLALPAPSQPVALLPATTATNLPVWVKWSNVGKDTPLSRWERAKVKPPKSTRTMRNPYGDMLHAAMASQSTAHHPSIA